MCLCVLVQCINDTVSGDALRGIFTQLKDTFFSTTLICWAGSKEFIDVEKSHTRIVLCFMTFRSDETFLFFCPAGNGIFTEVEISYDDLVASVSPLFARICSEEREIYDVVWKLSIRLLGGRFSVKSGTFVMIYLAFWKVALQKSKVHRKLMAIESNSFGWNAPQEQLRNVRNEMYETPPRGL